MASLLTITAGPLTTIFTPPPQCVSSWTYEAEFFNSVSGGLLVQNVYSTPIASTCFPPNFSGHGRVPSVIQVYSPGICPSGYQTPGEFNAAGTTTAICCPSGFSYGSTISTVNYFGTTSVEFMGCISTFNGITTVPARANATALIDQVVTGPLTMWGQPITVEYQQKDSTLFPASTSATTTTSSATSTRSSIGPTSSGPTTSLPPSSSNPAPSPNTGGLSSSVVAGIGAGAGIVAALLLGLGVFCVIRRRRKNNGAGFDFMPLASKGASPHCAVYTPELQAWERGELEGEGFNYNNGYKTENHPGYIGELEANARRL